MKLVLSLLFILTVNAQLEELQKAFEVGSMIFDVLGSVGVCRPPELTANGDLPTLLQTTQLLKERIVEYSQQCPIFEKYAMILLYGIIRTKILALGAGSDTHLFQDDYQFPTGSCRRVLAVLAHQWAVPGCNTETVNYVKDGWPVYVAWCQDNALFQRCDYEWQRCVGVYSSTPFPVADALREDPEHCSFQSVCEAVARNTAGDILARDVRLWWRCRNGELAQNDAGAAGAGAAGPAAGPDAGAAGAAGNGANDDPVTQTAFVEDKESRLTAHRVFKNKIKSRAKKHKVIGNNYSKD